MRSCRRWTRTSEPELAHPQTQPTHNSYTHPSTNTQTRTHTHTHPPFITPSPTHPDSHPPHNSYPPRTARHAARYITDLEEVWKKAFVRKVYAILSLQIMTTVLISVAMMLGGGMDLMNWLSTGPGAQISPPPRTVTNTIATTAHTR